MDYDVARRESTPMIANVATGFGLVLSLVGLAMTGWQRIVLLLVGLVFDVIDGRLARRFGPTAYGRWLDWSTDVAIAHVVAWRMLPVVLAACVSAMLVGTQAWALRYEERFSGRTAVVLVACAFWAIDWFIGANV